ncbi:MAG: carboxylating nicotinate-nucleotide diphosphorylase [Armatimonadota bacterium]|nr:carboxylating nicotinate-nucleotide diphosphorylase [Armatimonadota bacterium]MCX7778308.1 carboxylating nicotinate-nucleotide diphosphorylase [Armatimonadota bacterium]MDW8025660.1 carboxylating nicotinate-nucleotide diphosphorylase [Armatimonadota bacterium]
MSFDLDREEVQGLIEAALREDIGTGDITTEALIDDELIGTAIIVSRGAGCIAGLPIAMWVFETLDPKIRFEMLVKEGERVCANTHIAKLHGKLSTILKGERVALNFLQRLSGIATLTAKFVELASPYGVTITDTRKTTPCLRVLEKYAVRVGGGSNHRFGLYDAILIKDNHIRAVGSISEAVRRARNYAPGEKIEVETRTLADVKEAIEAGADIIMLDNMDAETIREAVKLIGGKAVIEASGNITLENVSEVASCGVNLISVGRITHSAPALDIALDIVSVERKQA